MCFYEMLTNVYFHPEKRQTMLFSATQTRKVEDLARISLKKEPLYVGVDDNKEMATVDGLEQVLDSCHIRVSSNLCVCCVPDCDL